MAESGGEAGGPGLRPVGASSRLYGRLLRALGVLGAREGIEDLLLEVGDGRRALVAALPGLPGQARLAARGWQADDIPVGEDGALLVPPGPAVEAIALVHVLGSQRDPAALLRSCRSRLAPRGRLIIIDENHASLMHRLVPAVRRHTDASGRLLVPEALQAALRQAGFSRAMVRSTSVGWGQSLLRQRAFAHKGVWRLGVTALDPLWLAAPRLDPRWGTQLIGWAMP